MVEAERHRPASRSPGSRTISFPFTSHLLVFQIRILSNKKTGVFLGEGGARFLGVWLLETRPP